MKGRLKIKTNTRPVRQDGAKRRGTHGRGKPEHAWQNRVHGFLPRQYPDQVQRVGGAPASPAQPWSRNAPQVGSPNELKISCFRVRRANENGPLVAMNRFMKEKGKGNYELVEPFDMDDATLADLSPQLAFILGVEYQIFRERLKSGHPFTTLCLPQNAARLVKMAEHHERFVEDRPRVFAGWTEIFVGDTIA